MIRSVNSLTLLSALCGTVLVGGVLACGGTLEDTSGNPTGTPTVDSNGDGVPDTMTPTDSNGDGVPDTGMDGNGDGVPDPVVDPTAPVEGVGWSTRLPRLSHRQWENSVRDLLMLPAAPGLSQTFSLDPDDARFDTYSLRLVSANLWSDLQRAAETLAAQVAQDPAALALLRPTAAPDDPTAFVTQFGRRAFRRPLTDAEIASYVDLFAEGPTLIGGDSYASGAELVIQAMLQSTHFLYRPEASTTLDGEKIWLAPYEVATRLSYALWDSMPSDALLDAADAGELNTRDSVLTWARQLLNDPRASSTLESFHTQLLDIEQYGTIAKNEDLFPGFTSELQPILQEEARLFINEVAVTGDGGIARLLTAPVTFVNQDTAPLYGVAGNFGADLQRVDLDPTQRAGFLTHVGFLSKYASQTQSDPILRGVHISLDVMCSALPSPPIVIPQLPAIEPNQTNRQRVEQSTSVAPCNSCHETFINPLGFAFENYDAVGQWRDTDNGQPVDATDTYTIDGAMVSYNSGVELSQLLSQSTSVHRCYARNWLEYVMGRPPTLEENGTLDTLAQVSATQASLKELLANITALETFRARPGDTL